MTTAKASLRFILVTVFLDVIGIGLMIPVLPSLIGEMTTSPDLQAYWYGALATTYGIMQFFCTPLLGALSDRYGRRPVLLLSIFGLGISYIVTAFTHSLVLLLLTRLVSGATGASFSVAAYVADITTLKNAAKPLVRRCGVWCWFYFWPDAWRYVGSNRLTFALYGRRRFVIAELAVWLFCLTCLYLLSVEK